jgi:hypothetical protein
MSMYTELRPLPTVPQGTRRSVLTLEDVARNVSRRHTQASIHYPEAVVLTAQLTYALYETLRNEGTPSCGLHSDKLWREIRSGEKALPLFDVARLAYGSQTERLAALKIGRLYINAVNDAWDRKFRFSER